jgi:uncharacterized protein YjbJ (UPF0337 family)
MPIDGIGRSRPEARQNPGHSRCWTLVPAQCGAGNFCPMTIREPNMNKDQVKGVGEQVKGKVNEAVGKATDDPAKELKGDLQQGAGKVQKSYGDAKEDAKDEAKENATRNNP